MMQDCGLRTARQFFCVAPFRASSMICAVRYLYRHTTTLQVTGRALYETEKRCYAKELSCLRFRFAIVGVD